MAFLGSAGTHFVVECVAADQQPKFAHVAGLPLFGVIVAVVSRGEVIAGIIYEAGCELLAPCLRRVATLSELWRAETRV
jgi:hypothetical protein